MKLTTVVILLLIAVLSIFTTLYFVRPRTVQVIGDAIPDVVDIEFPVAKPDTVYIVEFVAIPAEVPTPVSPTEENITPATVDESTVEYAVISNGVFASMKTFRKSYLYGDIESEVMSYGSAPAIGIENSITITPNKQTITDEINREVSARSKPMFWRGMGVGFGAVLLFTTIIMIAR